MPRSGIWWKCILGKGAGILGIFHYAVMAQIELVNQ